MSDVMNDAQQKLVEDNLKLVYHVVSKHFPTFKYDEDIISIGTMGLCNAALTWKEGKSAFSTYAYKCIRNAIRNEFRSRKHSIEVISLETPISDELTLADTIAEEDDEPHVVDYSFVTHLTKSEKLIYELRSNGYSVEEIEQLTGYSHRKVLQLMRLAKAKYRKCN
jgi:RNA polymerase sporulation-specific sigma factor